MTRTFIRILVAIALLLAGIGGGIQRTIRDILQGDTNTDTTAPVGYPAPGYPAPVEYEGYPAPDGYPAPWDAIPTEPRPPMQTPTIMPTPQILECSKDGDGPWVCYAVTATPVP